MSLSVKAGSFSTGTGALSSTVAVSDVGFQPVAVIFWWTGRTSTTDAAGSADHFRGVGVMVSSSKRWAVCSASDDSPTTADTANKMQTDNCILAIPFTSGSSITGSMDFSSFDSGGFTLVVTDVMPASYRIHYLAIGGDVSADAGSLTSTGASVSVSSMSWKPEVLFFGGCTTTVSVAADSNMMIGWCDSALNQGSWAGGSDDGQGTSVTRSYCRNTEAISLLTGLMTGVGNRARVTALNSDGFTLTVDESSISCQAGWLALRYVDSKVTSWTTGTGTSDVTNSSCGFKPQAVLCLSAGKAEDASDTSTAPDSWSFGAATAAGGVVHTCRDNDGATFTVVMTGVEHDNVYAHMASDAIDALAALKTFDTSGFTMQINDASPTDAFVSTLAIRGRETGTSAQTLPISTQSAAGGIPVSGTSAQTLPKVTQSSTGQRVETGTSAQTLPILTQSVAGQRVETGTTDQVLAIVTQIAAGLIAHVGTAAQMLPLPTQVSEGVVIDVFGSAAQALPVATQAATGQRVETGTTDQTLPKVTQAAIGSVLFVEGSAAQTLPLPTQDADGEIFFVTGATAQTLPLPTQSAAGQRVEAGTAASDLPILTQAAVGQRVEVGTADQNLPLPVQTAAGEIFFVAGSTAQVLPVPTQSSTGQRVEVGTADQNLPLPAQSSTGQRVEVGTAASDLPFVAQVASGEIVDVFGDAVMALPMLLQASDAVVLHEGTSAQVLPILVQVSAGILIQSILEHVSQEVSVDLEKPSVVVDLSAPREAVDLEKVSTSLVLRAPAKIVVDV